jgi:hypothetical protein
MLRLESEWLGERLARIPDNDLFPLLDLGSSTLEYRTQTQPYIERNIFAPLRARGGTVYHLDMKSDSGVDIVGDLDDPDFRDRVSRMQVRSVLISSLLQYVRGRRQVCDMVMSALPAGGYLFVSGPCSHPHDADPIDTMFRPAIEEIHGCFPGTRVIDCATIDGGNWRNWDAAERGGRSLGRTVVRLLAPFYRPKKWRQLARQSPYIFKHITATAVVLVKE